MLHTKVRREWSSLSAEERGVLSAAASAALGAASGTPLVARRLCLVLAAAGARSAPAEAEAFLRQALAVATTGGAANLQLALPLLHALAEEADDAPRARRAALLAPLAPALGDVLALCERALAERVVPRADALRCTLAWLRLHPEAPGGGVASGGFLLLSPPAFARGAPGLFAAALACMTAQHEADATAGVDLLVEVHSASNARDTPDAEAAVAEETIRTLLAARDAAAVPEGEPIARCGAAHGMHATLSRHS